MPCSGPAPQTRASADELPSDVSSTFIITLSTRLSSLRSILLFASLLLPHSVCCLCALPLSFTSPSSHSSAFFAPAVFPALSLSLSSICLLYLSLSFSLCLSLSLSKVGCTIFSLSTASLLVYYADAAFQSVCQQLTKEYNTSCKCLCPNTVPYSQKERLLRPKQSCPLRIKQIIKTRLPSVSAPLFSLER